MSKIHFELAKQYIQERDYDKAREILETMPDNPTAQKWLTKLNEIDPPSADVEPAPFTGYSPEKAKRMTSSQAQKAKFNRRLTGRRSRQIVGVILSVLGAGIMVFMLVARPLLQKIIVPTQNWNEFGTEFGLMFYSPSLEAYLVTALICGIGLALLYTGVYLIQHAEREPDHF